MISHTWLPEAHVYLLILISIFPGLVSTEMYNILINIIKIKDISSSVNQFWTLPYSFFLIIQILAWSVLLFLERKCQVNERFIACISYAQPLMIIVISTCLGVVFKNTILSNANITSVVNTVLEIIAFILMSLCLSRSKNKSLSYIISGFLFLIAFNLAHRFSYLTGHYYKSFDMIWLINYIIIIYGFSLAIKNKDEKIKFYYKNSIHVLINAVLTVFAAFLFVMFLLLLDDRHFCLPF